MHWQSRRNQFRARLNANQCVHPASVFDPVSARIAEDLGFELAIFAGSVASLTVLGAPDHIVLTLSEFAEQAYRINRASTIPLMVDADHGYGNALNVRRTVEELETAGVGGLSIEDTKLPQPFGASGNKTLISIEEGVGKMQAAVAARQDPALVIAARTSALKIASLDEALKRIQAYQATGVDAIFLIGVNQRSALVAINKICKLPLIVGDASADITDLDDLASLGVRICLQGHHPIMASINAVYATMAALRQGVKPADLAGLPTPAMLEKYRRDAEYKDWIKDFLA